MQKLKLMIYLDTSNYHRDHLFNTCILHSNYSKIIINVMELLDESNSMIPV
jgi:hypothetical protein